VVVGELKTLTPKRSKFSERERRLRVKKKKSKKKNKKCLVDLEVHIPAADVVGRQAVHVGWVLVKVGRVHCTFDLRDDGRRERPIAQPLPVESIKPPANKSDKKKKYRKGGVTKNEIPIKSNRPELYNVRPITAD
jgi:hypothetical protein